MVSIKLGRQLHLQYSLYLLETRGAGNKAENVPGRRERLQARLEKRPVLPFHGAKTRKLKPKGCLAYKTLYFV